MESEDIRRWAMDRAESASSVPPARVNAEMPPQADHDVHPTLLRALPELPRGVEYRVLHYDLILWDVTIDYVIDVLRGAFVAHTI
jgi:hypothetical protein